MPNEKEPNYHSEENIEPEKLNAIDDLLDSLHKRDVTKPIPKFEGTHEEGNVMDGIDKLAQEAKELRLKESEPRWALLDKGSNKDFLYRLIEKEFPEFKLRIREGMKNADGVYDPTFVLVEATPYETDRQTLMNIERNAVVSALTMSPGQRDRFKLGLWLEDKGKIPRGTTERALRRTYKYIIDDLKQKEKENPKAQMYREQRKNYEEELKGFRYGPATEEELTKIFRGIIEQELSKKE